MNGCGIYGKSEKSAHGGQKQEADDDEYDGDQQIGRIALDLRFAGGGIVELAALGIVLHLVWLTFLEPGRILFFDVLLNHSLNRGSAIVAAEHRLTQVHLFVLGDFLYTNLPYREHTGRGTAHCRAVLDGMPDELEEADKRVNKCYL